MSVRSITKVPNCASGWEEKGDPQLYGERPSLS